MMFPNFFQQGMFPPEPPFIPDNAETVQISAVALIKMLKHCKAGVPFEVMGIMLGEYVNEYQIEVKDVFSMPVIATQVSVESIDAAYQTKMLDLLKQVGRREVAVGWYHSHPGYGCWLSMTDITTQKSFERMEGRSVALVIDPVQSVPGSTVMDCFRTIGGMDIAMNKDPRITTSNKYHIKSKADHDAQLRGAGRLYYSMCVESRTTDELELRMLEKFLLKPWQQSLIVTQTEPLHQLRRFKELTKLWHSQINTQESEDSAKIKLKMIGKPNARKELSELVEQVMEEQVLECLGTMLNSVSF